MAKASKSRRGQRKEAGDPEALAGREGQAEEAGAESAEPARMPGDDEAGASPEAPLYDEVQREPGTEEVTAAAADEEAAAADQPDEPEQPGDVLAEPETEPEQPAPAPRNSRAWIAGGLILLLAVVAIASAWFYGTYGEGQVGWVTAGRLDAVSQRVDEVAAGVEAQADRVGAVEQAVDGVRDQTSQMADRVGAVEGALQDLRSTAQANRQRLDDIAASVEQLQSAGGESGEGTGQAVSELQGTVDELAGRIQGMEQGQDLSALSQTIARLEQEIGDLRRQAEAQAEQTQQVGALSRAYAALSAQVAAGAPFTDELEGVAALLPGAPGLEALRPLAPDGVATTSELQSRLETIAETRSGGAETPGDAGAGGELWASLRERLEGAVTIRRADEADWPAVLARAGQALQAGDIDTAVAEVEQASDEPPPEIEAWLTAARRARDANAALDELSAVVLRQLAGRGWSRAMLRMIYWFALIAALAALAAWLADRPGHIAIDWLGYHIETSLAVAILAILAVLAVLWLLWSLLRRILHTPDSIVGYFRHRRRRRGEKALSRGIVAVAAGDREAARRQADIAARLLPGDPLARLLEAQTAQLRGDHRRVERVFADMLADPETEVVALRGLYARARQAGEEARARELAERAYRRQPGLDWASAAVLKSRAAERDWPAVLSVLEARRRAGLIDDNTTKGKRAVVLTAQALEAEKTDAAAALDLAGKGLKLDPGLVPAAALLARVHFAQTSLRRGLKVIEKTWPVHPHPDLAEAYAHARPGDSAQDRLARIRDLLKVSPGGEEGAVALARVAIEARDWATARAALAPHAGGRPRARVCVLMAEIEEGELGDKGRAREWLARAVSAPRDPAWVADGFVSDRWWPVSPVSGELGAFVWKAPLESLGYTAPSPEPAVPLPPVIEAKALPPHSPAVAPQPPSAGPQSAAAPPSASVEPKPAPEPKREPEAKRDSGPGPAPQAARPQQPGFAAAASPMTSKQPVDKPAPTSAEALRQPDDPGLDGDTGPPSGAWARRLAGS